MNPPKIDTIPKNTTSSPVQLAPAPAPAAAPEKAKVQMKPVTIQLSADVHQKLRIVALSKGSTTSGLVEAYVDAALRKDLIVAMAKLSEG